MKGYMVVVNGIFKYFIDVKILEKWVNYMLNSFIMKFKKGKDKIEIESLELSRCFNPICRNYTEIESNYCLRCEQLN